MAFSPGNVFLSGEHSVGWGFPAILGATSIGTFSVAKMSKGKNSIVSDSYKEGSRELHTPLLLVEKLSGEKPRQVRVSSELPIEGGLSSSTAALVSIARALPKGRALSRNNLIKLLLPYQAEIHGGKCSGAEFVSSVFGGFNKVVSREGRLQISRIWAKPLRLLVTDTGIRAPTKKSFGIHMFSLVEKRREFALGSFQRIGEISDSVGRALRSGKEREEKLAVLFRENQSILKRLGVSHRIIEKISSIANKADPFSGTKLSGGGMGGVAITIGSNLKEISKKLSERGFSPKEIIVGCSGERPNSERRIK